MWQIFGGPCPRCGKQGVFNCCEAVGQFIPVPHDEGGSGVTQMKPTMTTVDQELLRRALVVANDAKELATEMLTQHDATLGRTTRKNRMWAFELERTIARAETTIGELRRALGWDKEEQT